MSIKRHDNTKNKNNISPMCDRCRKYNETIMFSTAVGIEKKYGK